MNNRGDFSEKKKQNIYLYQGELSKELSKTEDTTVYRNLFMTSYWL